MARPHGTKYIETPDKTWDLPFKKTKMGDYIIFPKHIGGKNCLRSLAESKTSVGYVYLLNIVGTNKYKIGVSTNPQRRLRDIASYIPFDLKLLSIHLLNNPYKHEQEFINKYKSNLVKNEWFDFSIETVEDIMIELHNKQVNESRETEKYERA